MEIFNCICYEEGGGVSRAIIVFFLKKWLLFKNTFKMIP